VGPAHEGVADHPDPELTVLADHADPNFLLRIAGVF
jgi:hypothetical protein